MSAGRAHQLGLVSEVVPAAELLDRAMWVATVIASQPVLAVQGTLRAVWMAQEVARRQALEQVSTLVSLGTDDANIEDGQGAFKGPRPKWRLR
jgi:enoyl-CoA hydratase/carnithine racemase